MAEYQLIVNVYLIINLICFGNLILGQIMNNKTLYTVCWCSGILFGISLYHFRKKISNPETEVDYINNPSKLTKEFIIKFFLFMKLFNHTNFETLYLTPPEFRDWEISLILDGTNIEKYNITNYSACLFGIAYNGELDLLKKYINPRQNMFWILYGACLGGQNNIIKYTLDYFNYIIDNDLKKMMEIIASYNNNLGTVKYISELTNSRIYWNIVLLGLSANGNLKNYKKYINKSDVGNGFEGACFGGHKHIIDYYIKNHIHRKKHELQNLEKSMTMYIDFAVMGGELETIIYLDENGFKTNSLSTLILACKNGHFNIVKYILKNITISDIDWFKKHLNVCIEQSMQYCHYDTTLLLMNELIKLEQFNIFKLSDKTIYHIDEIKQNIECRKDIDFSKSLNLIEKVEYNINNWEKVHKMYYHNKALDNIISLGPHIINKLPNDIISIIINCL